MKTKVMMVTPSIAAQWVANCNHGNRNVNDRHTAGLARDMQDGRWRLNGESIKFNGERLLDGQHRLLACIRADTPFTTLVVWGAEAQETIDGNRSRSIADVLQIRGVISAKNVGTALRIYASQEITGSYEPWIATRLTKGQMLEVFDQRGVASALEKWVSTATRGYNSSADKLVGPGTIGGLAAIADDMGWPEDYIEWFIERVYSGESLASDEPTYLLRKRLLKEKQKKLNRITATAKLALVIKAMNLTLQGATVKLLVWNGTGPRKETFPKVEAP